MTFNGCGHPRKFLSYYVIPLPFVPFKDQEVLLLPVPKRGIKQRSVRRKSSSS